MTLSAASSLRPGPAQGADREVAILALLAFLIVDREHIVTS
jgi:hypothetical protein